jgi:DNA invertase Pin-like site-specific DNA recombinase
MPSVFGAFGELKRSLIREREKVGVALAKQRELIKGNKKTLTPEGPAELPQTAGSSVPKAFLAPDCGISRETVYQYLRHANWIEAPPLPFQAYATTERQGYAKPTLVG